jgi:PKD repeat protein
MKTYSISCHLLFLCLCGVFLICPVSSYVVGTTIDQGATIFIGEQGLNLTPAQFGTYYGAGSSAPITAPFVDQNAATIGWWASAAVISTTAPTKTISLIGRNTSFTVAPADFVGYTGNWYIVNQTNGYADTPLMFTVSDPTLDLSIRDFTTSSDVTGTFVPRGDFLGFRITTNIYSSLDYTYRSPIYNSTTDGYIDITVKNESGTIYNTLLNSSALSNSLLRQNVSYQPWYWGNVPSAPFNWSTGVISAGQAYYRTGNYSVFAESQLNGMKDNYKDAGADYVGKTVSQRYFIILYIAPVADFTGTPVAGTAPLTVQYTDSSSGPPASWLWNFGDGTTSTLQNPSHTYSTAGTYTVALNATNPGGFNISTRTNYIAVSAPAPDPGGSDSGDEPVAPAPAPAPQPVKKEPVLPQPPQVPPQQPPVVPPPVGPATPETQPVEGLAGVTVTESYPVGYTGLSFNTAGDNMVTIDSESAREAGAVVTMYNNRVTSYQHNSPGVLITFWGDQFHTEGGKIIGTVSRAEFTTDPLTVNVSGGEVAGSVRAVLTSISQPVVIENAITGDIPLTTAETYNALLAQDNQSIAGIAYLMKFQKGNLTSTGAANVTMTVPQSWVDLHGGKDAVRIARTSDETGMTELLITTYIGPDPGGNMVFSGDSPHGTSLFGLITAQATAAEKKEHPNETFIPSSKPAMITNVGMFGWLVAIIFENPVVMVILVAVLAAAAYFGWWKRRL